MAFQGQPFGSPPQRTGITPPSAQVPIRSSSPWSPQHGRHSSRSHRPRAISILQRSSVIPASSSPTASLRSSVDFKDFTDSTIAILNDIKEEQKRRAAEEFIPISLRGWPGRYQAPIDPENSQMTDDQAIMEYHYANGKLVGLSGHIETMIDDINTNSPARPWQKFLEDNMKHPTWKTHIVASIPRTVIPHIIKGDLPAWLAEMKDQNVRRQIESELQPTTYPACYLNYFCQIEYFTSTDTQGEGNRNPNAGKWLSLEQLAIVLPTMRRYPDHNPNDDALAQAIDTSWTGCPTGVDHKAGVRRFSANSAQRAAIVDWVDIMDDMYIKTMKDMLSKDPNDSRIKQPLRRCHSECGWSINPVLRLPAHRTLVGLTAIFALFCATTNYLYEGKFELKQYVPLPVTKPEFSEMAEQVLTLTASAWIGDGGFNYEPPGSHQRNIVYDPKHLPFFERNFSRLYGSESFQRRKEDGHKTVVETVDRYRNQNEQALEDLKNQCLALEASNIARADELVDRVKKGAEAYKFKKVQEMSDLLAEHLRKDKGKGRMASEEL